MLLIVTVDSSLTRGSKFDQRYKAPAPDTGMKIPSASTRLGERRHPKRHQVIKGKTRSRHRNLRKKLTIPDRPGNGSKSSDRDPGKFEIEESREETLITVQSEIHSVTRT